MSYSINIQPLCEVCFSWAILAASPTKLSNLSVNIEDVKNGFVDASLLWTSSAHPYGISMFKLTVFHSTSSIVKDVTFSVNETVGDTATVLMSLCCSINCFLVTHRCNHCRSLYTRSNSLLDKEVYSICL